jgi:hypothetical protein
VRRADINSLSGRSVDPSIKTAAAWEDQRMLTPPVDDSKLKITIKGRGCDGSPHFSMRAAITETGL